MVGFANLALFQPYLTHRQLNWNTRSLKALLFDTPLAQSLLMWFGGRRHRTRRGQLGGDQGGRLEETREDADIRIYHIS